MHHVTRNAEGIIISCTLWPPGGGGGERGGGAERSGGRGGDTYTYIVYIHIHTYTHACMRTYTCIHGGEDQHDDALIPFTDPMQAHNDGSKSL